MVLTAGILTLGCKVNQYESRAMAELLEAQGVTVVPFEQVCDMYLIHSCTVTSESDRKVRQMVRRAVKKNPAAVVAVCGCAVQKDPSALAEIEGVSLLGGNRCKTRLAERLAEMARNGKPEKPEILPDSLGCGYEPMTITGFDRVRAYVKIQDGCESGCAYCIIPSVRGKVTSRPADDVVREITGLAATGCREVILTGIETGKYQFGLPELLTEVDSIDGIERIRLSSLDPAVMKPEFSDRLAKLRHFMPHFHVSLQSGCSRTLAGMRRKYTAETALERLRYLRTVMPDVQFSADVIVGFPGETDEDFEQTVAFVREISFLHLHIFPYSKRPGTVAAGMPDQVPESVKTARAARLAAVAQEMKTEILNRLVESKRPMTVLLEEVKGEYYYGHSECFAECRVPLSALHTDLSALRGTFCCGIPKSHEDGYLNLL